MANELMTPDEVAAHLRRRVRTLEHWRAEGKGPPYLKIEGSVLYSREALNAWVAERVTKGGAT